MSKYIDADLYVETQIYDDEHEEWGEWQGTIEDLLNQWTEQGCPSTIEVSEDCISRADLRMRLARPLENNNADEMYWKGWHDCTVAGETSIADAPSVVPSRAKSVWMPRFFQGVDKLLYECSNCHTLHVIANYCPNCGAKMKG